MGSAMFRLSNTTLILLLAVSAHAAHAAHTVMKPEAKLSAAEAADGSVLLVNIEAPGKTATDIIVRYGDADFPVFSEKGGGTFFQSVIAVPFNTKPGAAVVHVILGGGEPLQLPFTIKDGGYLSEVLKVDNRHINPRKKDLVRIKKESAEVGQIYRIKTREKYWDGPFALPVESAVTSPFGTRRMFNGEMKSFHQGLDLKAAVGTPIRAASSGVVVLAKDLFMTGNTVLIDHGYGIYTVYAHLSKLRVKKGQQVKSKHLLGLAGATGRASGPHLHWGAVVNRFKVNPADLTRVMR